MAREATLNVSLTPEQLKLVRQRVNSGHYGSASEVVRESLRILFRHDQRPSAKSFLNRLAEGYKALASHDRNTVRQWSNLTDAWPEK